MKTRMDQASIRRAFGQEAQRRLTIKELAIETENIRVKRLELAKASTVVECEKALKSWDEEDFGQGRPNGGVLRHAQNRHAVLDRVRSRSKPLPLDLLNDWSWFVRHWDAARVRKLHVGARPGWGSEFRDIVKALIEQLKVNENALAEWIRHERKKYLLEPALHI